MKISLFSRNRSDEASFEELVMPHVEGLYRLAYHYTQNNSDAEDLVQDLLIKVYKRAEELKNIEHLRPWLAKTLYHLFIDKKRQAGRQPVDNSDHYDPNDGETAHLATPSSSGPQRQDLIRDIEYGLSLLSEDHRHLIVMHDIESYTLEELSEILDTPVGTLKSRLHRGRANLRKILEEGTK